MKHRKKNFFLKENAPNNLNCIHIYKKNVIIKNKNKSPHNTLLTRIRTYTAVRCQ